MSVVIIAIILTVIFGGCSLVYIIEAHAAPHQENNEEQHQPHHQTEKKSNEGQLIREVEKMLP